jgi:16S rRNA C967 or C1407 C5-methylase (RsmB/RsmF family)/NOL1/NOP2/fmu family ribosome biogenesis protein
MNELPSLFCKRIEENYEGNGDLLRSLNENPPVSIRHHPKKSLPDNTLEAVPWHAYGRYLAERPVFTLDPLFHAGAYYPQEAGSMIIDFVLKQLDLPKFSKCLDLCAAPGGKSTIIADFLNDKGLLVSNEPIRNRALVLRENLSKWGYSNCVVSNNLPDDFVKNKLLFDFILVDAPCSGEGMFRKDINARNEWSIENTVRCSARQKDILNSAINCLKDKGYLLYSTCTFNPDENEENISWLLENFDLDYVSLEVNRSWNLYSPPKGLGYYCLPNKSKTEGFYFALLQHKKVHLREKVQQNTSKNKQKNSFTLPLPFHVPSQYEIHQHKDFLYAFPKEMLPSAIQLLDKISVVKWGIRLGEVKNKQFIPDHELALSLAFENIDYPVYQCSLTEALNYLKGNTIQVDSPQGWCAVSYKGQRLGWVKNLGNRANNYFPKEYRIRMEIK